MSPLLPARISTTPAKTPSSKPAIVDRTRPAPGSPAPKAEYPSNCSFDIIERTTAKKIKAPRSPHAVTVIHACRDHQRCSAEPRLGFMNRPCANRHSHIGESAESRIGGLLGDLNAPGRVSSCLRSLERSLSADGPARIAGREIRAGEAARHRTGVHRIDRDRTGAVIADESGGGRIALQNYRHNRVRWCGRGWPRPGLDRAQDSEGRKSLLAFPCESEAAQVRFDSSGRQDAEVSSCEKVTRRL